MDTGMNWRKSNYSMSDGHCVEAASRCKATYSHANGNSVETGHGIIAVRDSQLGSTGPVIEFSAAAWTGFVSALREGM